MPSSLLLDRLSYYDEPGLLDAALEKPGVDVNETDIAGMALLSYVCLDAYLHSPKTIAGILHTLIAAGADVNLQCGDRYSPLRYLALSFTYEPTEDMPGQPVLEDAVWDLFDILINAGADPDASGIVGDPYPAPAIRAYVEAWIIGGESPRTPRKTWGRVLRDL